MGAGNYILQAYMNVDMKAALSEGQRLYIESATTWSTAAFAIAVFAGLFGCILLLFRKKSAKLMLIISFLGVVVHLSYWFFSEIVDAYGPGGIAMPLLIIGIALFLVGYSKFVDKKGWLS